MSLKMRVAEVLLCVCLDLVLVHGLSLVPVRASPWLWLWCGALVRSALLLSCCWMRGSTELHSIGVLCFHFPVYTGLLWALDQPTEEQLWGCHSWTRVLQGYAVTALAWVYWGDVSPLLLSASAFVRSRLSPSPPDDTATDHRLQRLLGYMRPYFWRFTVVVILVFLSSYGEMAFPQYTGRVADWIMNNEAPDAFTEAVTVMALLTVASAVLEFICDLTYNVTMSHIHTVVQGEVFQAVLKQDISFFQATTTGELVSRITTDTNSLSEALSETLSLLMWYSARLAFILFFMLRQSVRLTLLTCMVLPLIWELPKLLGQFRQAISKQVTDSLAKENQVATETFSNMKTVRSFANEDGETERYRRSLDHTYALNKKEAAAYSATTWANSMTTLALKVGILYYGGTLVTRGAVSGGDLVAFVLYELQFTSAVDSVMRFYPEVKKAIGGSEKIFQYLDRIPQSPPDGTLAPEKLEKDIEFKNVTFAYPGMTESSQVLKGASFKLILGKTNALVGLNSSGKSTCVKLLQRFYQPQEGVILLDGNPLHTYKSQYLHHTMAVVSQDCLLFSRSVEENIKYGLETASEEDVRRAAELACAHTFITELSDGYNTDAGEKGGQVSGGQKQRISIARALIRRPQILILDNATSDLDAETEKKVHDALSRLPDQCTLLLISNKMELVRSADHVVYLHEGKAPEQGTHQQLMQLGGHYAALVDKQDAGFHRPGQRINQSIKVYL
ncbi:unnamed protein product [Knipowitschia caucasica]|uniref:Transporter 1, ATP-binding cassette, sub-family B (MDR/TAP) n=2 Tax=Knipowitschia caucasica TaxID=637954 RepID=A0AAV2MG42_KNICA